MVAIPLTLDSVSNVKLALWKSLPNEKSAFLTEALAAACGYRNHAALLARIKGSNSADPDFVLLDSHAFQRRLSQLKTTTPSKSVSRNIFDTLVFQDRSLIINTQSSISPSVSVKSSRQRVWRNMMVAAINNGIERRLFTIRAGDNRWISAESKQSLFQFQVCEIPAVASVMDAGWDELSIHVAFWPTEKGEERVGCMNAGFLAGDCYAEGWLERRDGAWLQRSPHPILRCRKSRISTVANLSLSANGYSDVGAFKL